jgi:hypothetical protein
VSDVATSDHRFGENTIDAGDRVHDRRIVDSDNGRQPHIAVGRGAQLPKPIGRVALIAEKVQREHEAFAARHGQLPARHRAKHVPGIGTARIAARVFGKRGVWCNEVNDRHAQRASAGLRSGASRTSAISRRNPIARRPTERGSASSRPRSAAGPSSAPFAPHVSGTPRCRCS